MAVRLKAGPPFLTPQAVHPIDRVTPTDQATDHRRDPRGTPMSISASSSEILDPAPATLTLSAFLERFEDIVEESTGFVVTCPAHDDSRPSLRVGFNPDTKKLALKCRAGCRTEAVVEALGLS